MAEQWEYNVVYVTYDFKAESGRTQLVRAKEQMVGN